MQDQKEPVKKHDLLNAAVMAIVLAVGTADIVRYIMLGEPVSLVTICVIEILFAAFSRNYLDAAASAAQPSTNAVTTCCHFSSV